MIKHLKINVRGKVQGVYYRASTAEKARELGLKGFVRNQGDGSVYIEVEGDERILDQLVSWCNQGPPAARVDECVVEQGDVQNFKEFSIQR